MSAATNNHYSRAVACPCPCATTCSTPHLTTLDLHDNLLDFRCLDVLLPALPQLPRLHTLDISGSSTMERLSHWVSGS